MSTYRKRIPYGMMNFVAVRLVSLLYYFGMTTIAGTSRGKTRFVIPNQVVREQLYTYLLETYDEVDLCFSSMEKSDLNSGQ